MNSDLKKTPLADWHESAGAKMVDFGGWYMPVRYSGIVEEHLNVRKAAGLFDVSHMGQFRVTGNDGLAFLQSVTCNDISKIQAGKAQYNAILYPNGTVVDDIIVYQCAECDYLIVVNASNIEKDFAYLQAAKTQSSFQFQIENHSDNYALIAIQGPKAVEIISKCKGYESCASLKYFEHQELNISGVVIRVARTGYTGEDGFEIFLPPTHAQSTWEMLLKQGGEDSVLPIGLGARDTLRLEACYPLYGHELSDQFTALQSGLGWICKFNKGDFCGKNVLTEEKATGIKKVLVAFEVIDAGIVREGTVLQSETGAEVGLVTSGTKTPTIDKSIGMAIVNTSEAEINQILHAKVRDKLLKIKIVNKPFYKKP